jgi:hypothetical protein
VGNSAPPRAIDPLILIYEDKDERVRARAMELIEQDGAWITDAERSSQGGENTNGAAWAGDSNAPGERLAIDLLNQ